MSTRLGNWAIWAGIAAACRSAPTQDKPEATFPSPVYSSRLRPGCREPVDTGVPGQLSVPSPLGDYCWDPGVDSRVAGGSGDGDMLHQCRRIIGSQCDSLEGSELQSLTSWLYRSPLDGSSIDAIVLQFRNLEGSFAWFAGVAARQTIAATEARMVGEVDTVPVRVGDWLVSRRATVGLALLHTGVNDRGPAADEHALGQMRAFSRQFLSEYAGPADLPDAVLRLPAQHRVAGSIRLVLRNALGLEEIGNVAFARYWNGTQAWQVFAIVCGNSELSQDVMARIRRSEASGTLRWAAHEAFRYTQYEAEGSEEVQWVIGRAANVIYGVGEDPKARPGRVSAKQAGRRKLTTSHKQHLLGFAVTTGQ